MEHNIKIGQLYKVECYDENGKLKWKDGFENLVVTTGRNQYLDATLKTGATSPTWFVGLKDAVPAIAADTMASHAGWAELAPYSNATRPAFVLGTIANGSVDNSASKAVFTINATATVGGAFIASNSTKSGTTGILLGAGEFASARSVLSGDTLNVTVTCSITST
jgi:predicted hotdog family 3-hydroxylacyl-ACP dehydratase